MDIDGRDTYRQVYVLVSYAIRKDCHQRTSDALGRKGMRKQEQPYRPQYPDVLSDQHRTGKISERDLLRFTLGNDRADSSKQLEMQRHSLCSRRMLLRGQFMDSPRCVRLGQNFVSVKGLPHADSQIQTRAQNQEWQYGKADLGMFSRRSNGDRILVSSEFHWRKAVLTSAACRLHLLRIRDREKDWRRVQFLPSRTCRSEEKV